MLSVLGSNQIYQYNHFVQVVFTKYNQNWLHLHFVQTFNENFI